jgi:Mn2+/Fe2+ NRAMP family transporter
LIVIGLKNLRRNPITDPNGGWVTRLLGLGQLPCVKARLRIIIAPFRWISVWGPGLLVMLADTDAGNVVTGAQAGARWGYRLLPLLLVLMPMLYMVQELTVRLGIYTGRGHGELIRERFGVGWAWLSTAGLAAATIGSLVTEFTGVAGIGELYGLSRSLTLPVAAAALLIVVATGSYRRVERIAIVIGLFELAFFAVAWAARPNLETLAKHAVDLPLYNREFLYLARPRLRPTRYRVAKLRWAVASVGQSGLAE